MMNFKYYLLFALLVLSVSSCKKYLDREPQDFLDPEAYYETEAQLNYALNGVYDALGNGSLYGTAYPSRIGMEADEGAYKDNSLLVGPQVYDFSTSDNYVSNLWKVLYEGIGRANYLLARVDKNMELPEALRKRVRGEATFLRAYYHFLLVQHFGKIPLILEPTTTNPENVNIPQTPAKEAYEHIIGEMEIAEGLVDPIKPNLGGRVNKSAVRGILARVCLYMAGYPVNDKTKYEKAKYWAKQVIDDGIAKHTLNPSYEDIFTRYAKDQYDAKESIWEVEFYGNTSGTYRETGTVGSWLGIPSGNAGVGTAYGFITVNRTLWDKYEAPVLPATTSPDLRREWNIAGFTYNTTTGLKVNNLGSAPVIYWQKFPGKYRRELEVVIPKANNTTPINYPLLRFSDVLLMYAEAENEISGPSPDIIDKVNLVRQRGYGYAPNSTNATLANLPAEQTNSYLDFAQAIRDERSRELCFEGLRKPDLIRWGLFIPTMKTVLTAMNNDLSGSNLFKTLAFKNVKDKHVVFPIPAREMQLNKALIQNTNW